MFSFYIDYRALLLKMKNSVIDDFYRKEDSVRAPFKCLASKTMKWHRVHIFSPLICRAWLPFYPFYQTGSCLAVMPRYRHFASQTLVGKDFSKMDAFRRVAFQIEIVLGKVSNIDSSWNIIILIIYEEAFVALFLKFLEDNG